MQQAVPFGFRNSHDQGKAVLTLCGEIDLLVGPVFDDAARSLANCEETDLVFDLSEVTFMDSTGLSVIATTLGRVAPRGGRLLIRGASPSIRRLLQISGLDQCKALDITDAD